MKRVFNESEIGPLSLAAEIKKAGIDYWRIIDTSGPNAFGYSFALCGTCSPWYPPDSYEEGDFVPGQDIFTAMPPLAETKPGSPRFDVEEIRRVTGLPLIPPNLG